MKKLHIDLETYSEIEISMGIMKYTQDPNFKILLFAYSIDDEEVQIVDLENGEEIPKIIKEALEDDTIEKHAHNANFEYLCLKRYGFKTNIRAWRCSMIKAMYCGYPASLDAVGSAMGFSEDKKKKTIGKSLIRFFSVPKVDKEGNIYRNLARDNIEKWELFKDYCKQDVVVEKEIERSLSNFSIPDHEQELWSQDIEMQELGIKIDKELVQGALYIDEINRERIEEEVKEITKLDNPNSSKQLLEWLNSKGIDVDNIQKATISEILKDCKDKEVIKALKGRQELGKTSIKKYHAMKNTICLDGRVHGILQFYGANRTGRWAGRLVQVQNLPRNNIENLDIARELVKDKNIEGLEMLFGNISDTLSQLIRTAFIAEDNKKFVVADFSAIEARVIAWLGDESWRQEVFRTHGKIYEASASQMFNVSIEKIKKGNPEYELRAKGKIAELALGYGGSAGALKAMGANKMGLNDEEITDVVTRWRKANRKIVGLWYDIEKAALKTIKTGKAQYIKHNISFHMKANTPSDSNSYLVIKLPSQRELFYVNPKISLNKWGKESIVYMGNNQTTKKWEQIDTYGGKLTENIVQAIARDCLAILLLRLYNKGYKVVMHIHDEVVVEAYKNTTVEELCNIMSKPISWAPNLYLKGAGFESPYYMKD